MTMVRAILLAFSLSLRSSWVHQTHAVTVQGIQVHPVPLRRSGEDSPFCYAVSSAADLILHGCGTPVNFLATQVWPSARLAAMTLERHLDPSWTTCEFGCGPGLPSLVAANLGASMVVATDVDTFALDMVQSAAAAQKLTNLVTTSFDLTTRDDTVPEADLYLLSDVFESASVARGAAVVISNILSTHRDSRVWVFTQTDRAQREVFLKELTTTLREDFTWQSVEEYDPCASLCLFDVDESKVSYG